MSTHEGPALVICDGGLASLLACWAEGVCRPTTSPTSAAASLAWIDPRSTPAAQAAARRAAAASQLTIHGGSAGLLGQLPPGSGWTDTATLVGASIEALHAGLKRIIWPVQLGSPGSQAATLDAIADIFDRAMLAARLLSIDTPGGLVIETPYADLSDAQLIDLAADLDAPAALAAWCQVSGDESQPPTHCGRCTPCRRWSAAAQTAGLVLADLGIGLVEQHSTTTG